MTSEMMPGCPHCGCHVMTHACPGPDGFANTRLPAPAAAEIARLAEAWARTTDPQGREDAKAAFTTALSALRAEVREATGPIEKVCDEQLTAQDVEKPDDFSVTVSLPIGDLRRLAALHRKMEDNNGR